MAPRTFPIYPLKFAPIYKEKVWGGRWLEKLGRQLPGGPQVRIGESWDLVDLGRTTVTGGGGGVERSLVTNGPLAGQTLHELMTAYGKRLMGDVRPNEFGEFPLLVKFLDARQNLSVQVHPSKQYACRHEDAFLKSEAWYVVHAEPGSVIYKGIRRSVKPQQFRRALEEDAVEPLLLKVPVKPGDCHYLPSGTCHALGAGVLVAEVQTPSDTTFRVYDWGRTGRQLHIDQALECIKFGPPDVSEYERHSQITGTDTTLSRLVTCEHFRIEKVCVGAGYGEQLHLDQPAVWVVLEGGGTMVASEAAGLGANLSVTFGRGQTLLVPPGPAGGRLLVDRDSVWLQITFGQGRPTRIA